MPRPRARQAWFLLTTTVVLLTLLSVAPLAVAADEENLPPVISAGGVRPTSLPSAGGEVTISVRITDDHDDLALVYAQLFGWDTSYQYVPLAPTGGDTYGGSAVIGPNPTVGPVSYWLIVSAEDGSGLYAEDTTEITVAGPPPPASRCPPRMPAWAASKARCGRVPPRGVG
jgi:hypothetical protein